MKPTVSSSAFYLVMFNFITTNAPDMLLLMTIAQFKILSIGIIFVTTYYQFLCVYIIKIEQSAELRKSGSSNKPRGCNVGPLYLINCD